MTDKKRGRPPGSKNKPKTFNSIEEFKEDLRKGADKAMEEGMKEAGLVPETGINNMQLVGEERKKHLEKVYSLPDGVIELRASEKKPAGLAIDISKFELPFPSNWNEMGKVQKLEWLTANPRK